jgi:hypothetical protein
MLTRSASPKSSPAEQEDLAMFQWILNSLTLLIAAASAAFAALTYRRNANTKRAEFLLQLHQAFFVDDTYKPFRTLLDDQSDAAIAERRNEVAQESPALTDFLNFFEMIAYLEQCKTLQAKDFEALLGYYLHLLKADPIVSGYVADKHNSFEHLSRRLKLDQAGVTGVRGA